MIKDNVIVLNGGLGNQLFQIGFGFYLEKLFNVNTRFETSIGNPRTSFAGDIEANSFRYHKEIEFVELPFGRTSKRVMNKLLRIGAEEESEFLILIAQKLFSGLEIFIETSPKYLEVARGLGYFNLQAKNTESLLHLGYFQTYKWVDSVSDLLFKMLPKKDNDLPEWKALATSEKPIALHLRLGDYKNERFGIPQLSYYQSGIRNILDNDSKREYGSVWVFSDEPKEAKNHLNNLKIRLPIRYIDSSNQESAWTLQLMRHCSAFLIANSTFSWWGSYLRYDRMAPVIAPKPWFRFGNSPNEICPPDWIRISAFNNLRTYD